MQKWFLPVISMDAESICRLVCWLGVVDFPNHANVHKVVQMSVGKNWFQTDIFEISQIFSLWKPHHSTDWRRLYYCLDRITIICTVPVTLVCFSFSHRFWRQLCLHDVTFSSSKLLCKSQFDWMQHNFNQWNVSSHRNLLRIITWSRSDVNKEDNKIAEKWKEN